MSGRRVVIYTLGTCDGHQIEPRRHQLWEANGSMYERCYPSSQDHFYAGHVHSGKRNYRSGIRPSVRQSVCPIDIFTVTYQGQHATRPAYISAR